jgi:probable HAF family extracellular repeat protein
MFHTTVRRAGGRSALLEALEDRRLLSGYTATELDLGLPPGALLQGGLADNSTVLAQQFTDGTQAPAVRHNSGAIETVNAPSGAFGFDLNASGAVVGAAGNQAFYWKDGAYSELPGIGGANAEARALNNSGDVVGQARQPDGFARAVLWHDGTPQVLGTLGGRFSDANDINESGQVVGESGTAGGFLGTAFLYADGQMTSLGYLGQPGPFSFSNGLAINNSGEVTGGASNDKGQMEAFVYAAGRISGLGTLGGVFSLGLDLNDSGVVVGQSNNAAGQLSGFVWTALGGMIDLNTLVTGDHAHLDSALAVNQRGQILAIGGRNASNAAKVYLLTPTDDAGMPPAPAASDGTSALSSSESTPAVDSVLGDDLQLLA